jgi:hypothetical protein
MGLCATEFGGFLAARTDGVEFEKFLCCAR